MTSSAAPVNGEAYQVALQDVLVFVGLSLCTLIILRSILRRLQGRKLRSPKGQAVLITGCDTGFGRAAALKLSDDGYTVFAGCLDAQSATATTYALKTSNKFHVVQMDVCDAKQVASAVKLVSTWLQGNPDYCLKAVVANAGVAKGGYAELLPMALTEQMINVNLIGAIRVVKAFLPVMRLRGNVTDGRIVLMSSLAAHFNSPGMSGYCATKAGLLAFADSLRFEIERFGISVSTILPDFYATEIVVNIDRNFKELEQTFALSTPEAQEAYNGPRYLAKMREQLKMLPTVAKKDLSPVINAISHAIGSRYAKRRYYPTDFSVKIVMLIAKVFPSIIEFLVRKLDQ